MIGSTVGSRFEPSVIYFDLNLTIWTSVGETRYFLLSLDPCSVYKYCDVNSRYSERAPSRCRGPQAHTTGMQEVAPAAVACGICLLFPSFHSPLVVRFLAWSDLHGRFFAWSVFRPVGCSPGWVKNPSNGVTRQTSTLVVTELADAASHRQPSASVENAVKRSISNEATELVMYRNRSSYSGHNLRGCTFKYGLRWVSVLGPRDVYV